MDVIFLGGFFPKQFTEIILSKSKRQVQNAANRFQWGFINGLKSNLKRPIKLITAPFIGWYPKYYEDFILRTAILSNDENLEEGIMVGFCNLPLIKNIFKFFNLKSYIKKSVSLQEKTIIIVYTLDAAYLKAAIKAKEFNPKLRVCVIIPDLHEFPGDSSTFYKWYIRFYEKPTFYKLLSKIDCFVVLSDKMVDYLNINDKPWVRIEGLYQVKDRHLPSQKLDGNIKVILYAGTLDYKYGIKELLDAFGLIKLSNYRLWICGGGVGAKLVKKRASFDERIKYFGVVSESRVEELQAEATVLINPRNTIGEYNKYSFPSKTMEYLASGTPVLMYRLEGIPEEYFDYCYTINDEKKIKLADAIYDVCQLDRATLRDKGNKARDFILKYKNSVTQCKRVIDMIEKLD